MANYFKTVLYAYPETDRLIEAVDNAFVKKLKNSQYDYSDALSQCEELLRLTSVKASLIKLKRVIGGILATLTEEEMSLIRYKYFGSRQEAVDVYSRTYYRRQVRLANKIAKKLESVGITEEWVKSHLYCLTFFKEIDRRLKAKELRDLKRVESLTKKRTL
ncbi:MAG: hypothetical protein MJ072_01485 [Clostridia bacterium]|nr:hypothetical protein [Clostridia bacterium]